MIRICVLGIVAGTGGIAACGSGPSTPAVSVASSSNPAMVALDLRDGSGEHVGSCSGTLVSPTAVLTAGHCVVAAQGWKVTSADGQTAQGALTWSTWQDFQSPWSHPKHSDVGVILLDRPILVSSYPTIARMLAPEGTVLARMRRTDAYAGKLAQFEQIVAPVYQAQTVGFPLAYATDTAGFEGSTDTGGALIDPATNTIYGVVSSRGATSGRIYVSRVEYLADWIQSIASCNPPPTQVQCHHYDGGSGSGSGSSGGTTSGSSSGWGGNGSGSSSGGGGNGSGSSSGWGGGSGSGSGSGGNGSGSGGSSNGGGDDDGGMCNPPPAPPPPPPPPMPDGGTCNGGGGTSSGAGGTASSGGGGHSPPAGNGSSGGASSGGDGSDGGIVLIPDGPGCTDWTCGGCGFDPSCNDGQQDYGDCGCQPPPEAGSGGPIQ